MSQAAAFNCEQIVELVTDYLEGALSVDERLAFEQHVSACASCRGYFTQMRTIIRVAGSLHEDDLPEPVRERLVDAFRDWHKAAGS
jgi:predicted anti-sigma-YlaC factor YlaD